MRKSLLASAFLLAGAVGALAQAPVTVIPIPGTVQGQVVLTANTSTSFNAANSKMAPNSQAFPTNNLFTLNFLNESSSNSAYVCIQGGTDSATAGCTFIGAGATIQITFPNPGAGQSVPTLFSLSGATIDFWN